MSNRIADAAKKALTSPGFETDPGYCSRWVRQVVHSVTSDFDSCFGASANQTGRLLRSAGYAVSILEDPQPGDILVKYYAPYGHIGICIGDGLVAENSTAHYDKQRHPDARGTRTLARWGHTNELIRLPNMAVTPPLWTVLLNDVVIGRAVNLTGKALVPVHRLEEALGLEFGWRNDVKRVVIEGQLLDVETPVIDGHAHVWARDLAEFHGLAIDLPKPQTVRFRKA